MFEDTEKAVTYSPGKELTADTVKRLVIVKQQD
jgi:hypothetical protein